MERRLKSRAKSNNSEQNLEQIATCPVCHRFFKEPKKLPNCSHTLCLGCVRKLQQEGEEDELPQYCWDEDEDGECYGYVCYEDYDPSPPQCPIHKGRGFKCHSFKCPVCRRVNCAGPRGIKALQTNSIAREMVKWLRGQSKGTANAFTGQPRSSSSSSCRRDEFFQMETLKVEVAGICEAWAKNYPLPERAEKLESLYNRAEQISTDQFGAVNNQLGTSIEKLKESISAHLHKKAQDIVNQAKTVQTDRLSRARQAFDMICGKDTSEDKRVNSFLGQSSLKLNIADVAELHKTVLQVNKELMEADSLPNKFNLEFHPNERLESQLLGTLEQSSMGTLRHKF